MWHDSSFIYVTWRSHVCDMTHSCMWHDSFIYITWLMDVHDMVHSYIWYDALIYVTWRIHIYDMTHLRRLIYICDVTHLHVRTFYFCEWRLTIYMTWQINVCEMTDSYSWRNALLYVRWLIRKGVISYICELCLNASCHEHENDSFIIVIWIIHVYVVLSCFPNKAQETKRSIWEYFLSSCHTYKQVSALAHIWWALTHSSTFCFPPIQSFFHIFVLKKREFMSGTWTSHAIYMNESQRIHQCVMSYMWMSHVTYIYESRHLY